ncbi:unnamed protein product [Adineta ricciae]|uniref:F-box domain-containing protein n=1 Tax=Adineta ricciae TaxID=249248 RepID=A0A814F7H3_ADIRI|nr:unnamed protein product [Adineta ricciae]CAF0979169.1 unnamed protein product [Adineta ricciae]
MSYTRIEDLSNEIFYEIFEYIECNYLYQAFSNLNARFKMLLDYPFLSLRMNLSAQSECEIQKYRTRFIMPNKHRIASLDLHGSSSLPIDSSFTRLHSLICNQVPHHQFVSILPILTYLPRLSSINVHFSNEIVNLTEIYQSLFLLPCLTKLELSAKGYSLTMTLLMNQSERYSTIKHLVMNHPCKLEELIILLSYVPSLRHLTCMELCEHDQVIPQIMPLKLMNLRSMTIHTCNVDFNQFEIFIQHVCKQLRYLCMTTSHDISYLDANRWERLISQYLSSLRILKFTYDEYFYQKIELASYHDLLNQFTTPFWLIQGWLFCIIVDIDYWPPIKISYSIDRDKNRSVYSDPTGINLTIDHLYFAASRENLVDKIFSFICKFSITHLHIDCQKLFYPKFIQLLQMLPNLKSLTITSLSYFKLKNIEYVQSQLDNNQIASVEIQSFMEENDLEKIQFFINLCPSMEFLQVKCKNIFNISSVLQCILSKNLAKFSYLSLWLPLTNDKMIKELREIVNQEQLLAHEYRITRTSDRIYVQLKL